MKKIFAALFCAAAIIALAPGVFAGKAEGECGASLMWQYDADEKTLVIHGEGNMEDFDGETPWEGYKDGIKNVVVTVGATSIGDNAFSGCGSLSGVTLPDSVTSIGKGAFSGCESLPFVNLPRGVKTVGDGAFSDCTGISYAVLPKSLESLGATVFLNCPALKDVYFTGSEEEWKSVFADEGGGALASAAIHFNYTPQTGGGFPFLPVVTLAAVVVVVIVFAVMKRKRDKE